MANASEDQTPVPNMTASSRNAIVVGVDGSPQSLLALRRSAELARQTNASLEPVIAWQYLPVAHAAFVSNDWAPDREAASVLNRCLFEVFGEETPDWVHASVVGGPAARCLIDASSGATMLVVGSRGHGGFAGLLLGSVSSACAEYAHCPVLVMRVASTEN